MSAGCPDDHFYADGLAGSTLCPAQRQRYRVAPLDGAVLELLMRGAFHRTYITVSTAVEDHI